MWPPLTRMGKRPRGNWLAPARGCGWRCGLICAIRILKPGAVWWAQAAKLVIGLALVMAVRVGMKPVLASLFGDALFTHGVRYFLMAVVGGVLWPMTFRFWARLGQKEA